jgi:hypothetical protein
MSESPLSLMTLQAIEDVAREAAAAIAERPSEQLEGPVGERLSRRLEVAIGMARDDLLRSGIEVPHTADGHEIAGHIEDDTLAELLRSCSNAVYDLRELTAGEWEAGAGESTREALATELLRLRARKAGSAGPEAFAAVFEEVVWDRTDIALEMLEMPAATSLPRSALLPLLNSGDPKLRLAAIGHLGRLDEGTREGGPESPPSAPPRPQARNRSL